MNGIIVHEWLEEHGGAENVVDELANLFPEAPIYTLWNDSRGRFPVSRVKQTWMARTSLRRSKQLALPFMPWTWRHLGAAEAEWVLSSSHLFAHHAAFTSGSAQNAARLAYVHTPARYIWTPELDPRGKSRAVRAASYPLKKLDKRRAQELDALAGNSEHVVKRIGKYWEREAKLIYPPVNTERFSGPLPTLSDADQRLIDALPDEFILGASRLVPYKQLDSAIRFGAATGVQVIIAGAGPDRNRLESIASEYPGLVTFLGAVSSQVLHMLYLRAKAYIFLAIEDFGIMPVEAMAAGTPVITRTHGGAAETVLDGITGAHVGEDTADEYVAALDRADKVDPSACIVRASEFSAQSFQKNIAQWVVRTVSGRA